MCRCTVGLAVKRDVLLQRGAKGTGHDIDLASVIRVVACGAATCAVGVQIGALPANPVVCHDGGTRELSVVKLAVVNHIHRRGVVLVASERK